MLEGVLSMQNLISDPVSMTSCRQEAYLLRLRRQFPFVYVKTLTRTAFGRSVYALQFGSGSRKLLITAGHHANETITSDAVWQWLFTFCNALLDGRTVCGAEARELYHNAMVYLVPLVETAAHGLWQCALQGTTLTYCREEGLCFEKIANKNI